MQLVGNIHLVEGSADALDDLILFLEGLGHPIRGNVDAYIRTYGQFGIDEARELRERAYLKGGEGSRRIFILVLPGMTNEAQNGLLKTLEEPPADAFFFFLIPAPSTLLPTLLSRAQLLHVPRSSASTEVVDASAFLAALPRARLDMLKLLLEKDDDDKRDLGAVITFLSSLERMLENHAQTNPLGLDSIYRARRYLGDKGALVKPLLEQVALLAPVVHS